MTVTEWVSCVEVKLINKVEVTSLAVASEVSLSGEKKWGAAEFPVFPLSLDMKQGVYQQQDTCFTPGRGTEWRLSDYSHPTIIKWTAVASIALFRWNITRGVVLVLKNLVVNREELAFSDSIHPLPYWLCISNLKSMRPKKERIALCDVIEDTVVSQKVNNSYPNQVFTGPWCYS